MAEFKLKTGETVLIDAADLPLIAGKNWRLRGGPDGKHYVAYTTGTKHYQKVIYLHRLLTGASEDVLVDHKNRNTFDYQRANLRLADYSKNSANSKTRTNTLKTSKFKGVYWNKANGKWMARVAKKYIGYFIDEVQAAKAYNKTATELFGDFASLNPV